MTDWLISSSLATRALHYSILAAREKKLYGGPRTQDLLLLPKSTNSASGQKERKFVSGFILTCVAVCEGVEVSWDVSSPEEAHHLCLHVSIGRLWKHSENKHATCGPDRNTGMVHVNARTWTMSANETITGRGGEAVVITVTPQEEEETDGCVAVACSPWPLGRLQTPVCH